ncbi:hypothetical protein OJ996_23650 [Luteolibacter sp. GHJ8]|uniref:Uncharacterized protein n=1 Tax=Luteolibacter rhizosphaerae TaxID=2989719 RepID=A0ABT3G9S7_9BACT|nr:hypothetical protein [Luteolibacter rhizosphaerae]MCW1916603.1 hypothetical protein [Luteolibacter rhizosphaerae]
MNRRGIHRLIPEDCAVGDWVLVLSVQHWDDSLPEQHSIAIRDNGRLEEWTFQKGSREFQGKDAAVWIRVS